jgi:hypothetical protein
MHPEIFPTANGVLRGSGDVADLPVRFDTYNTGDRFVESCWRLGWRERLKALVRGRVYLVALGVTHPPVLLSVDPTPAFTGRIT